MGLGPASLPLMAYCELQMIEFNVNKWACAAVLAAASAVCLSGCARDYPEPGKSAFKKAIEEYADSHKSCIEISPAVDSDLSLIHISEPTRPLF